MYDDYYRCPNCTRFETCDKANKVNEIHKELKEVMEKISNFKKEKKQSYQAKLFQTEEDKQNRKRYMELTRQFHEAKEKCEACSRRRRWLNEHPHEWLRNDSDHEEHPSLFNDW